MDIFSASRAGNKETILSLVQSGISVNEKNENGHSPLMLAAYNCQYEACKILLELGADPNSIDNSKNSILMGVVFKGHTSIFDLLAHSGADLNYHNSKNQSAMDLAVMFGRRDLIYKINKLQNTNRSEGKIEQIKTWVQKLA